MLRKIATALGRLYTFMVSFVVALILGVATWGMWQYYRDVACRMNFLERGDY